METYSSSAHGAISTAMNANDLAPHLLTVASLWSSSPLGPPVGPGPPIGHQEMLRPARTCHAPDVVYYLACGQHPGLGQRSTTANSSMA